MRDTKLQLLVHMIWNFLLFVSLIPSSQAAALDWAAEQDQKIRALIEKKECEAAFHLTLKASEKDKFLDYLPKWYDLLVDCYQASGERDAVDRVIRDIRYYHEDRVAHLVDTRRCKELENHVQRIQNGKYKQYLPLVGFTLSIARCHERGDPAKSLAIYNDLLKKQDDTEVATRAQFRINYLTGDRAWIFRDLHTLVEGVKEALRKKDAKLLERYASKSEFSVGFEQAPPRFFREEVPIFTKLFQRTDPVVGELKKYDQPTRYVLKVSFPGEKYPDYYFVLMESDGGWQWVRIGLT